MEGSPQFLGLVRLDRSLDSALRNLDLPFPAGPLYHYTTVSGFHGIVGSDRMWATHRRFMNDPSEDSYGIEVLRACIPIVTKAVSWPEVVEVLNALPTLLGALPYTASYLTCFTEVPDSLVLWNTYTPEARGIAIEFDAVRLITFARGRHVLTRVCYELEAQLQLLETHLRTWSLMVADSYESGGSRISEVIEILLPDLIARMFCAIPALKSPAFQHEREWRLIAYRTGNDEVMFRPSHSYLIPYVSLQVGARLPITGLVLGPNCPKSRKVAALAGNVVKEGWLPQLQHQSLFRTLCSLC